MIHFFFFLLLILAYTFPSCKNYTLTVTTKPQNIACEGLMRDQNMYWAVSDADGQERLVAECGQCLAEGSCNCNVTDGDFRVTRTATSSNLQIVDNTKWKDGDTLTCSEADNLTHAQCTLKAECEYNIRPYCDGGWGS